MNKNLKVGIFLVAGIAIFLTGIFLIGKKQNLFGSSFNLATRFNTVSGLMVGNNVRYSGINIGTVSDIILINDSTVEVNMIIESGMKKFIRKDSRCLISSEGLMGDKNIVISQGTLNASNVKEGDILASVDPVEMDEIINELYGTVENANVISGELAILVKGINDGQGTLGRLLTDSSMARDVTDIMENLNSTSESLDENMEAAQKSWLLRGAFRRMEKEEKEKKENANKK